MRERNIHIRRIMASSLLLAVISQACTLSLFSLPGSTPAQQTASPAAPTPTPYPVAQSTFIATIPEPLQSGESLVLAVVDEVTGLPWNVVYYPMTARDTLTYTATLPIAYNTLIKYKYVKRGGRQSVEDTTAGAAVRYRLYYSAGPAEIQDIVADWDDKSYSRPTGSIAGHVMNSDTGRPIPGIMVSAGGVQVMTDSSGYFEINGLPNGTHNLIVHALDGFYQAFQQGAVVAPGQTTAVDLRVKPAPLVRITFVVSIPGGTVPGVPVRLAGSLLQLGNTFADLQGGMSVSADRMPVMGLQPDGRYSITLSLPAGTHIQYKYTLGDGFWNAEHKKDGGWVVRDLIVPTADTTLQDTVQTWNAGNSSPILFETTAPSVTPQGDVLYIQFNTYGWAEPLPMWSLGGNRWAYKLYGPLTTLGSFGYRYCRNGQCGSADDRDTPGFSTDGRRAGTSLVNQDIQDTITGWYWYDAPEPGTLSGAQISPRGEAFAAGIEMVSAYRPNWSYYIPRALNNIHALGGNEVVFTPSWTFSKTSPLTLQPVPGQDALWIDSAIMLSQAKSAGLRTAIFPTLHFPDNSAADFWLNATRDAQWWQAWFTRYRSFAINFADLAAQSGAQTLILGGEEVAPAMPGGKMPDGAASNVPADAEAQWKSIIAEVRSHFNGKIYWALPYTQASIETPLDFLKDVDGIYLLWSAKLTGNPAATKADLANEAGRILDNEIAPLVLLLNKPLTLAVGYPSAAGAASGCVSDGGAGCLPLTALSRPNADVPSVTISLQAQADLYDALLNAANPRPWISGFVSRGYYPVAALQDKSMSIHSKPAADILWYWYPRLLGRVQ